MGKLTLQQIHRLKNNDLTNFTREHRFYCDSEGNGVLHYLVKDVWPPDVKVIQVALDLGVSPHTFNQEYKSPIDYAMELPDKYFQIADLLLQQPFRVDDDFLNKILGNAIQHYQNAPSQLETIVGFFASRLCGVDIHKVLNKEGNNTKYKAHLDWLSGTYKNEKEEKIDLEFININSFLSIRIRSMFELFIKVYAEAFPIAELSYPAFSLTSEYKLRRKYLHELTAEIKRDVQTCWIERYIRCSFDYKKIEIKLDKRTSLINRYIRRSSNDEPEHEVITRKHQSSRATSLAEGCIKAILVLKHEEAVIIATSWNKHALYLQIRKIEGIGWQWAIYNLGGGCNWHDSSRPKHVHPYQLGTLPHQDAIRSDFLLHYLHSVFLLLGAEKSQEEAQPIIYRKFPLKEGISTPEINVSAKYGLPDQRIQTASNCTAANHDAARELLMPVYIYKWIQKKELEIPKPNIHGPAYVSLEDVRLWDIELADLSPYLPAYITKLRDDFYKTDKQNKFLSWDAMKRYFVQPMIQMQLDTTTTPIIFKNWLDSVIHSSSGQSHPIYVLLGESGAGKSSCLKSCADEQWQQLSYRETSPLNWLPIFMTLNTITQADIEQSEVIEKWFATKGCSDKIEVLKKEYHFLFLLDGYDEVKPDIRTYIRNTLIPSLQSEWKGLTLVSSRLYLEQELSFPKIYLQKFDSKQREEYLQKYEADKKLPVDTIKNDFKQHDMLASLNNPLLLSMLLDMYATLQAQGLQLPSTRYAIYIAYTKVWFERELKRPENSNIEAILQVLDIFLDTPGFINMLLDFAGEIAFGLFNNSNILDQTILYPKLYQHVQKAFPKSLLIRQGNILKRLIAILPLTSINQDQSYQFIHHSFNEFFLAHFLAQVYLVPNEQQALQNITVNTPLNQTQPALLWQQEPGVIQFLADRVRDNVQEKQRWLRIIEYSRKQESKTANKPQQDSSHIQYQTWKQQGIVDNLPALSPAWQQWKDSQNKIKAAAANAITILNYARVVFSGRDLSGARIKGANLNQAIMHQTNLSYANLKNVHYKQSYLQEADLSYSKLANVEFGELAGLQLLSFINCLAYSPDGKRIAVGCEDGRLYIFDWQSGQHTAYSLSVTAIVALTYHPSGKQLAFANQDNIIYIWDIEHQEIIQELEGHTDEITALAYHPSGSQLASGSHDTRIFLWTLENGYYTKKILGKHKHWITCLSYHPNLNTMQLASGSYDKTIFLWDVSQNYVITALQHEYSVYCLAYHPSGRQLASGDNGNVIYIWDIETRSKEVLSVHIGSIMSLAWHPTGIQLASAGSNRKISLWHFPDWQLMGILTGHEGRVMNIAYNPAKLDGQLASTSEDKSIRLWQVPAKPIELPRFMPEIYTQYLVYSASMRQLAFVNEDETISLWDLSTKKVLKKLPALQSNVGCMTYHPSGTHIVVSLIHNATINVYDIESEEAIKLSGHSGIVTCLAYHPSGQQLVSGSEDKTIRLWNLQDKSVSVLQGHSGYIRCLAYHTSGKLLASASDNVICVWETQGNALYKFNSQLGRISYIAFHPSRQALAVADTNGDVYVWDITTKKKQSLTLPASAITHAAEIIYLGYILPEQYLLSCDATGKVLLWDMENKTLAGHYQLLPARQLIYDKNFLILLGHEGAVSYWQEMDSSNAVHPQLPRWQLQWASYLTALNVTGMNIRGVADLATSTRRLLQKRGASEAQFARDQRTQGSALRPSSSSGLRSETTSYTSFLSLSFEWMQAIYSGNLYHRNSAEIKAGIEAFVDFPASFNPQQPEGILLHFLYLCVAEVFLQNECKSKSCQFNPIDKPHLISDHLKQLFFKFIDLKYSNLPFVKIRNDIQGEYSKLEVFKSFLPQLNLDKGTSTMIESMLLTLYPFIKRPNGQKAYDICGYHRQLYDAIHTKKVHPYVRLSGQLGESYFSLDCHTFDMRGVDLSGSKCYSREFESKAEEFLDPNREEFSSLHSNFIEADLRFANLSNTHFYLEKSIQGANLTGANLEGSNIDPANYLIKNPPKWRSTSPETVKRLQEAISKLP